VPDVDLASVVAEAAAGEHIGGSGPLARARSVAGAIGRLAEGPLAVAREGVEEVVLWGADPIRPLDRAKEAARSASQAVTELRGSPEDQPGGSPLWASRSRHRHLEVVPLSLEAVKSAAKALGGSVNDVFLTGVAEAASTYHQARSIEVEWFNATFVVSTRADSAMGGNSFTPARIQLPAAPMDVADRFRIISDKVAAKRARLSGPGVLSNLAGLANLLPTSVVTSVARAQAAKIDFATSNFRAAPFEVHVGGARLLEGYALGPVAGTAFNVTTMSYDTGLYVGALIDPVAVDAPAELGERLTAAFAAVLASP
jgi:hypothetical protein